MLRLGLIGKDISHSRSPEMYKRLIHEDFTYDLLDYANESSIPDLASLRIKYDGLNITAPYKKHFLTSVELTPNAKELNAINCLKFVGEKVFGENTDYLAILKLLPQHVIPHSKVKVLGDGAMASVVIHALNKLKIPHEQFSRKKDEHFDTLNFNEDHNLIINCCGRGYVYDGSLTPDSHFWDLNYNSTKQWSIISNTGAKYSDGLELLELQALYAVQFWSAR